MQKPFLLLIICALVYSCGTTRNSTNQVLQKDIIGQNEMTVFNRLGAPTRVEHFNDGRKVMIYEYYSKGKEMFLTPNKSAITYNPKKNMIGDRQGWTFTTNVNTATNDPKYTIYPTNTYYFKVYIDKKGSACKIEQNLSKGQLEAFHERFKHFSPYQ